LFVPNSRRRTVAKPKAEYTVTLNEPPMTQEEISAKYVENLKKYLQQQIDFYKKLNQLKRNEMTPSKPNSRKITHEQL